MQVARRSGRKKKILKIHDHNVRGKELIMTRKAAVDSLRLEFTGGEKRSAHYAKWSMGGLGWLCTLLAAIG